MVINGQMRSENVPLSPSLFWRVASKAKILWRSLFTFVNLYSVMEIYSRHTLDETSNKAQEQRSWRSQHAEWRSRRSISGENSPFSIYVTCQTANESNQCIISTWTTHPALDSLPHDNKWPQRESKPTVLWNYSRNFIAPNNSLVNPG